VGLNPPGPSRPQPQEKKGGGGEKKNLAPPPFKGGGPGTSEKKAFENGAASDFFGANFFPEVGEKKRAKPTRSNAIGGGEKKNPIGGRKKGARPEKGFGKRFYGLKEQAFYWGGTGRGGKKSAQTSLRVVSPPSGPHSLGTGGGQRAPGGSKSSGGQKTDVRWTLVICSGKGGDQKAPPGPVLMGGHSSVFGKKKQKGQPGKGAFYFSGVLW